MFDSAPLLRVYIQRAIIPIGLKDLVSTFILNFGGPEIVLVRFARANLRRSGWVFDELTRKDKISTKGHREGRVKRCRRCSFL